MLHCRFSKVTGIADAAPSEEYKAVPALAFTGLPYFFLIAAIERPLVLRVSARTKETVEIN